ncbi:hypothetical protein Tco_0047199 [Tanacetum coccineum]
MEQRLGKTHQGWMDEFTMEICVETKRIKEFKVRQNEKRRREDLDILEERREIASIREAYYKHKLEGYYNKRVRPSTFKPGRYGVSVPELHKKPQRLEEQYDVSMKIHMTYSMVVYERFWKIISVCMTRSSTKELFTPFKDPEQEFRSTRKLFKTPSLDDSSSPEFDLFSDLEDQSKEEVTKAMGEPTMEEYMMKTQEDYGSGVARPKIDDKAHFELKDQFLKELRDYTFSGSDNEDANEHIEKVLEIVDLAASRWLRNEPPGSIITWEVLKKKFLSKYCPPARIAKKIEEINNFQQEHNETLYQAWEIFKELLMRCPQHYLTDMPEDDDVKKAIQEIADHSQKWHNVTEIKKVNEKVYAAQVGCESCGGPYYSKDFPLKEEGKTLEEAYTTLTKANNGRIAEQIMAESAKSHDENSNLIKEIQVATDAAIKIKEPRS